MAGRRRIDAEECKLFVGGLTRDTTADMLKGYFSYYGRVVHAVVMTNPETQKSRGFGFVAFEHPEIVDRVLLSGPHFLDGKQIDPKPSVPKDLRPKLPQVEQPKKAFLGGLPLEMNEADLREYFSQYGVVTECYIMFDEKRMKSRGFGFVSFEDDSIVDELVSHHFIDVRDKRVEIKLARPRENPLAPLNSEGRVLSVESQQQRIAAAAAVTVSSRGQPASAPYGYEFYDYYSRSQDHPQAQFNSGPPPPKRLRGAMNRRPSPDRFHGYDYSYGGYDNQVPPSRDRYSPNAGRSAGSANRSHVAASTSNPLSTGASSTANPFSSASPGAALSLDSNNMTPESMTTLMQQAMQNMGGVGVNMMMPMLMSNMMTQMFMNQAQTMFQSVMQQKSSSTERASTTGTSKSEAQASGPPGPNEMMDTMKTVLQSLMSSMQQPQHQEKRETQSDATGK